MSLESLPESERAAWLKSRDQVAGFLVHIGQKIFQANEGSNALSVARRNPKRISFSAKENGQIDIRYDLPFDVSGLTEAWNVRAAMEHSPGLRFLSDRILPESVPNSRNTLLLSMRVPEPMDAASLSAVLKESLSEFCLKDIEVSVDGEIIPPVWDQWQPGSVRGNGRNYSIAMCNGIPVCRREVPEGTPDGEGVVWFATSMKSYFTPAHEESFERMAQSLSEIKAPSVSLGLGAIKTQEDDLSLEARLVSWGLTSMRDVTQEFLSGLSADDAQKFLSSVVSGESAYQPPDLHVLDRGLPESPLSDEMSLFIDMWGAAARQAAKAAGMETIRIGFCSGQSVWANAADNVPVLYIDPDNKNFSSKELLSEAIYMISGIRAENAAVRNETFDRARDVANLFAKADKDDDAYVALRKDLRSKMGQAAIVLREGIPDQSGRISGLSDRLLKWAWPEQDLSAPVPADDFCETATLHPLPEPEPVVAAVMQVAPIEQIEPEPEPGVQENAAGISEPEPEITVTDFDEPAPEDATIGRDTPSDDATIGRVEGDREATNGRTGLDDDATNGRHDAALEATNGRVSEPVEGNTRQEETLEKPQDFAIASPDEDWMSGAFFEGELGVPSDSVVPSEPVTEPSAVETTDKDLEEVTPKPVPVRVPKPRTLNVSRPRPVLRPVALNQETAPTASGSEGVKAEPAPVDDFIPDDFFAAPAQATEDTTQTAVNEQPVEPLEEIGLSFFDTNDLVGGFTQSAIEEKASHHDLEQTPAIRPVALKPVPLKPVRLDPGQMM